MNLFEVIIPFIIIAAPLCMALVWGVNSINKKFDKIDVKFDKIDVKFDKIEARFDKLDDKIERIDRRLSHIEGAYLGKDLSKFREIQEG